MPISSRKSSAKLEARPSGSRLSALWSLLPLAPAAGALSSRIAEGSRRCADPPASNRRRFAIQRSNCSAPRLASRRPVLRVHLLQPAFAPVLTHAHADETVGPFHPLRGYALRAGSRETTPPPKHRRFHRALVVSVQIYVVNISEHPSAAISPVSASSTRSKLPKRFSRS